MDKPVCEHLEVEYDSHEGHVDRVFCLVGAPGCEGCTSYAPYKEADAGVEVVSSSQDADIPF